ncbi:DNA mismatch repair protein MutT [Actinoallomurus iriomotensis]|uniref:DNA mismatch repair protein MutT n=1 Tax=Actinoallomurus iriomotensis TaxID=478107 RepID=A0A9W6VYM2_9ACTN|nr:NUDIX domain-containing protein [Actinoallomurus iriomotensis]GLY85010.1 DNA mismatch repair protein MutT [Actinoallomurus iriomotensis]
MDLVLDVVGWVHVSDGRLLAVRARARDRLYLPGGKREPGEDDWTALSREVREELGVHLDRESFHGIGVVEAPAHDQPPGTRVRMACYTAGYHGEFTATGEVDEWMFVSPDERHRLAPAVQAALELTR